MDNVNVDKIRRGALRCLATTAPATLGVMLAWAAFRDTLLSGVPTLVLMLYLMLLLTAACSAAIAAMAALQLATARAFRMGYATARLHMADELADDTKGHAQVRVLRSVE